jgi:type IV secretion system protein VirB9
MIKLIILLLILSLPSYLFGQDDSQILSVDNNTPKKHIIESKSEHRIIKQSNIVEYPFGYSQPTVTCTPLRLSAIELQKGEELVSVSIGDKRRWVTAHTSVGKGANKTMIVLVKPKFNNITTNLLVTTDLRIYDVTLDSPPSKSSLNPQNYYTRRIKFYYPDENKSNSVSTYHADQDPIVQKANIEASKSSSITNKTNPGLIDIGSNNFSYKTYYGDHGFPWEPEIIYDDGRHMYIVMPRDIEVDELPALYALNDADERVLINYTFDRESRIFITDRIFFKGVLQISFRKWGFLMMYKKDAYKELFIERLENKNKDWKKATPEPPKMPSVYVNNNPPTSNKEMVRVSSPNPNTDFSNYNNSKSILPNGMTKRDSIEYFRLMRKYFKGDSTNSLVSDSTRIRTDSTSVSQTYK